MNRIIVSIIVALLCLGNQLPLLHAGAGKSGNNQLKVDVGARAVSMGGVQFGAEGSAFGMYYNPAFITGMSQQEIGFMHNEHLLDFRRQRGLILEIRNQALFQVQRFADVEGNESGPKHIHPGFGRNF